MKFVNIFLLFIFIINIYFVQGQIACTDAKYNLDLFWYSMNNIKHGVAINIILKNYYCPACTSYMKIWNNLKEKIKNIEKNNLIMITFDCACSLLSAYCEYFKVRYYPTFRLLYPIKEYESNNPFTDYILPNDEIYNIPYKGNLTIISKTVQRSNNIQELQDLIKTLLCENPSFDSTVLFTCTENGTLSKHTIENVNYEINSQNLRVTRWKKNVKPEDIKHDIMIGIIYTLRQNVSMGKDVTHELLEDFINMLNVVKKIYSDLQFSIDKLIEELKNLKYPVKYDMWIKMPFLKIGEYDLGEDNKFNFKVCNEESLFCTFWLLYHKLSIYALNYEPQDYMKYKNLIISYTKSYLNCDMCINHFLTVFKKCYFGSCNDHSAQSLVILLWRIHNAVTLRTLCESVSTDIEIKSPTITNEKFLQKDIVFPCISQCKSCRDGEGLTSISLEFVKEYREKKFEDNVFDSVDAFNIQQVIQFLMKYYA